VAERVFPARPFEIGGGRILPTPNQFYLTGEDRLRIVAANSLVGVSLKIQVRTANVQGETVAQSFDHTPNSDRSVTTEDYAIGNGSILNLTVFVRTGAPKTGHTFVIMQLVRGVGAAAIVLGTLAQGYVTAQQAVAWPGSPLVNSIEGPGLVRYLPGTTPAVNVEIVETVPTGARWALLSFIATLTPAGGAGLRTPMLFFAGAGVVLMEVVSNRSVDVPNSLTISWSVGIGAAEVVNSNYPYNPLPIDLPLLQGASIRSLTFSGPPIGQWSGLSYVVREWLEL
jgi:hypothetical protein